MSLPKWSCLLPHQGTLKLAVIGLIILSSLYPLHRVHELVRERQAMSREVEQEIAKVWGGAQEIVGPVLVVPLTGAPSGFITDLEEGDSRQRSRFLFLLPESLKIDSRIEPELRARGIYQAILYRSQSTLAGTFARPDLDALGLQEAELLWDQAWLEIPAKDLRGLVEVGEASWNQQPLTPARAKANGQALILPLPVSGATASAWPAPFEIALAFNGSGTFSVLPLGRSSEVTVTSTWPHPSFTGDLLPNSTEVGDQGFAADWSSGHIQRGLAQAWVQGGDNPATGLDKGRLRRLAVRLLEPVDSYLMSERSVKYGLLFVALISAVLFVFEAVAGARVHPVQYAMVASALCLFFLLLLSTSEVIGFSAGYGIAATLTTALLAGYVASILKSRRRGILLGGLLALVYGALYLTLRSEDHALLLGSSLLFAALALAMFVTRKIDWYALGAPTAERAKDAEA